MKRNVAFSAILAGLTSVGFAINVAAVSRVVAARLRGALDRVSGTLTAIE
jgi:hypothetical protein